MVIYATNCVFFSIMQLYCTLLPGNNWIRMTNNTGTQFSSKTAWHAKWCLGIKNFRRLFSNRAFVVAWNFHYTSLKHCRTLDIQTHDAFGNSPGILSLHMVFTSIFRKSIGYLNKSWTIADFCPTCSLTAWSSLEYWNEREFVIVILFLSQRICTGSEPWISSAARVTLSPSVARMIDLIFSVLENMDVICDIWSLTWIVGAVHLT